VQDIWSLAELKDLLTGYLKEQEQLYKDLTHLDEEQLL
jgi:hypothetical protein